MSNHFHLLVRVPDRETMPKLTKEALLELLPIVYDASQRLGIEQEIERAAASDDPSWLAGILERFEGRRHDLASFVKDMKQRFTRWYNRENNRRGTLWEDRYKSVLVEGSERAGKLSIPEIIRCRVRYLPRFARPSGCLRQAVSAALRLCDGAVFGSVEFVNGIFEANRWRYGPTRKTGARKLRGGADWGELRVLRNLQKEVIRG